MNFINEIDNTNCEEKIDFGPMPVANAFSKIKLSIRHLI